MKGRLIDLSFGMNKKQRITIEVDSDFREHFDRLRESDISIEIKKYREKRSKDANAYFHVLVNKIAEAQGLGNDEVKKSLVIEYGALARDEDGSIIVLVLPEAANIDNIYPYTKCYEVRKENNRVYNYYMVYKHTHELDSKEMSRLIDGAIYVAKDLGIQTETPEQIAKYKNEWGK